MKLIGNLRNIKSKRDSKNADIELHLDTIEYITYKKDGRYFQAFDFLDTLETPLVITGDCLALTGTKSLDKNEYEFHVYDKVGDEYVLNPDKYLSVTTEYIEEDALTILSEAYYSFTIPTAEFDHLKSTREKEQLFKNRKSKRQKDK